METNHDKNLLIIFTSAKTKKKTILKTFLGTPVKLSHLKFRTPKKTTNTNLHVCMKSKRANSFKERTFMRKKNAFHHKIKP